MALCDQGDLARLLLHGGHNSFVQGCADYTWYGIARGPALPRSAPAGSPWGPNAFLTELVGILGSCFARADRRSSLCGWHRGPLRSFHPRRDRPGDTTVHGHRLRCRAERLGALVASGRADGALRYFLGRGSAGVDSIALESLACARPPDRYGVLVEPSLPPGRRRPQPRGSRGRRRADLGGREWVPCVAWRSRRAVPRRGYDFPRLC
mmetsp:Transcript_110565/g.311839  ORF Transcript_110565/g.311839 Transcript_110565/m.311839 type:complete len:208 (+) Transcript_110565:614-1237(+)